MNPITYDQAVAILDEYIQKKTTHGVKDICKYMSFLCNTSVFTSSEDKTDFTQICSNFDLWVRETERTSIGRKQFEEWWEVQFTGTAGDFSEEALREVHGLVEDQLPEEFGVNAKGTRFTDINIANAYIAGLEAENKRLRSERDELRWRLHEISKLAEKLSDKVGKELGK